MTRTVTHNMTVVKQLNFFKTHPLCRTYDDERLGFQLSKKDVPTDEGSSVSRCPSPPALFYNAWTTTS